ncbi:MAG: cation:proton antiporter [Robiginitomaculum sp.]|nr:MAG: cation:proton antiporter [Robiginitomaculum sp.]
MTEFLYYINVGTAFFLLIGMVLLLARLLSGPTLYDRILAVNSFGTKIVLFLAVFALIIGRDDGVDIAILYALMNFIATIAVLKFFRYSALGVSLEDDFIEEESPPVVPRTSRANKGKQT